jgi:anti-sigma B factor antagonist
MHMSSQSVLGVIEEPGPDATTVLTITGDLDLVTAPQLDDWFDRLVAAGADTVVIDLAGVGFVDSSGVRTLITGHKALHQASARLVVRAPSPSTRRLFDVTGLSAVLAVEG